MEELKNIESGENQRQLNEGKKLEYSELDF